MTDILQQSLDDIQKRRKNRQRRGILYNSPPSLNIVDDSGEQAIKQLLKSEHPCARQSGIRGLMLQEPQKMLESLKPLKNDKSPQVRLTIVEALADIVEENEEALAMLQKMQQDPDPDVQKAAEHALSSRKKKVTNSKKKTFTPVQEHHSGTGRSEDSEIHIAADDSTDVQDLGTVKIENFEIPYIEIKNGQLFLKWSQEFLQKYLQENFTVYFTEPKIEEPYRIPDTGIFTPREEDKKYFWPDAQGKKILCAEIREDIQELDTQELEKIPFKFDILVDERHSRAKVYCTWARSEYAQMQILNLPKVPIDPVEKFYQVLPLLKKVKPEKLPKEECMPQEERRSLRAFAIQQWEEYQSRNMQTTQELSIKEVLEKHSHFVVLGPPGSGKSTLIQYLVWEISGQKLQGQAKTKIPVLISLREWEQKDRTEHTDFLHYLVKKFNPLPGLKESWWKQQFDSLQGLDENWWKQQLEKGHLLLLLDGLDEISSNFQKNHVNPILHTYSSCSIILTCRTVSFEQHKALEGTPEVFTISGIPTKQRDQYIRSFVQKVGPNYNPEQLIQAIEGSSQIQGLASNPLLLSIICYLSKDGDLLPQTRAMFYRRLILKLMQEHVRQEVHYPSDISLTEEDKLDILALTALDLFQQGERKLVFSSSELTDALERSLEFRQLAGKNGGEKAIALRQDFITNSGLLQGNDDRYFFLHLTIQEYLSAKALARIIEKKSWDTPILLHAQQIPIRTFISHKAWTPLWHEVITLFVGELQNPLPLLQMLSQPKPTPENPHGDDLFRHRLALAAICLGEISEEKKTMLQEINEIASTITTTYFNLWWNYDMENIRDILSWQEKTLPALAQMNALVLPKAMPIQIDVQDHALTFLSWLAYSLREQDGDVRSRALDALEKMGDKAANEQVISSLLSLLRDPDSDVRKLAVYALGEMGDKAANEQVISSLLPLLCDQDSKVRSDAAHALGEMGDKAANEQVISSLLPLLRDQDSKVRSDAVCALGEMGDKAANEQVISSLLSLLRDQDSNVRSDAVCALGEMGDKAANEQVISSLLSLLRDQDSNVRSDAVCALGEMGDKAANEQVISSLLPLLRDQDSKVRSDAAHALEGMGDKAANEQVTSSLLPLLRDQNSDVRSGAAYALGEMGKKAANEQVISSLLLLLRDQDSHVRSSAVEALGKIGEKANEQVISSLLPLLRDQDSHVGNSAVNALRKMGKKAANEQVISIISSLLPLLRDQDPDVRSMAAYALGEMGEKAANEQVISSLLPLLRDQDYNVRRTAVKALEEMGEKAANEQVISSLLPLLRDQDFDVCISTKNFFQHIMQTGMRFFGRKKITIHKIEDLAQVP